MGVDIDIGADVWAADGVLFGKVSAVVIDREVEQISYLVVRRGFPFLEDKAVPVGDVGEVTDHQVRLAISGREAADLPNFEGSASVPLEVSDQDARDLGPPGAPNIWAKDLPLTLPPLVTTATNAQPYVVEHWRNVPEGSLALREGLPVRSQEGYEVGAVDELVTDPVSHAVTHVVVRETGPLRRDKAIPVEWIERSDEDTGILLAASRRAVEELPDYH